jgi:hypothetical protein
MEKPEPLLDASGSLRLWLPTLKLIYGAGYLPLPQENSVSRSHGWKGFLDIPLVYAI